MRGERYEPRLDHLVTKGEATYFVGTGFPGSDAEVPLRTAHVVATRRDATRRDATRRDATRHRPNGNPPPRVTHG